LRLGKLLQWALPLVLFLLVSLLFHYRAFTEWMLIAPDNDALQQNYPYRHLYSYALKNLEFPLWNPYVFAGLPFMAEMQNGALYPLNVLFYSLLPAPFAYNLNYVLHFALAGFFTYMYLRLIGVRELPALAGGMVFGFSGFLIANKDHTAMVNSSVYLPLLLCFLERLRREPRLAYLLFIALVIAVQVFAGNMQVCVYTYMVAGMFLLFYSLRKGFKAEEGSGARFFVMGALGVLLGIVIASPQLVSTSELSGLSWLHNSKIYRGYIYFSLYHIYLVTLPSLLSPSLFDGWGPKDGTLFIIGVLPVIFALVSSVTLARRNHFVLFWGLVALVGLVLSLGSDTPLNRVMYRVPVYNVFRAHGRNILEFALAVSVLFSIGLETVFYGGKKGERYLRTSLVLLSSVVFVSVAVVVMFQFLPLSGFVEHLGSTGFQRPDLIREKISPKSPAVLSSIVLMAVYLVWLALFMRFKHRALKYALILIVALEIFYISGFRSIDGPRLAEASNLCRSEPYGWFLDEKPHHYRMANIIRLGSPIRSNPSSNLTCRLGSISGYDPLVLEDYAAMLDLWRDGTYTHRWRDIVLNNVVLGMLGVKYLKVTADADFGMQDIKPSEGGALRERINITGLRVYYGEELDGDKFKLEKGGMVFSSPLSLDAGTYAVSIEARSPGGAKGRLTVNLAPSSSGSQEEVLHIIPDRIGGEFEEFHQVFRVGRQDVYMLAANSYSEAPIEVKEIRLQRLNNYSPFSLLGGVLLGKKPSSYKRLFDDGRFYIYLNRNHLPRAWSVGELVEAEGVEDVKKKLFALEANPSEQALLSGDDIRLIGERKFRKGEVEVKELRMNKVVLRAAFPEKGFVVLADQYYPGWKATVDGEETGIYRVNGILRGVVVPGGEHTVEFVFRPYTTILLLLLSALILSGIAVYLMAVGGSGGNRA
jgi:hypothetical protein